MRICFVLIKYSVELERNVYVDFVRLVRNWYSKLTASVMWSFFVDVHFCVILGGVLSPLFSVYLDDPILAMVHTIGSLLGVPFCRP